MNQQDAIARLNDQTQKALLMSEDDIAGALFRQYQASLNDIIKDLMWLNQPVLSLEDPSIGAWRSLQLDTASLKMISEKMTGLHKIIADQLLNDLTDFSQEAYSRTAWTLDQTTPPTTDIVFNVPTDDAIKTFLGAPWKGEIFSDRVWAINDTMARNLQQTLVNGIQAGDSTQDIARAMRSNVGIPEDEKLVTRPQASAEVYRAMLIARSETMRLSNAMRNKAWEENKRIMTDLIWSAAPGLMRVCDFCAELDGRTYDDIKENDGEDIADLLIDGICHPNGRCIYQVVPKPFQELLGENFKGVMDESIGEYEMRVPNPSGEGTTAVTVTPYADWISAK